ncbi:MAG: helix-turn-helix domain-containing protein [Acidimicrobiales bacterium]
MNDSGAVTGATFGDELRRWRDARRFSQLALAAAADVSQRHLSFLETGRSKPSRDMVLHLAQTLELPLRARNALLAAAGFSAEYPERAVDEPAAGEVGDVLQTVLDTHSAFPTHVVDRGWDIVVANPAWARLVALSEIDVPVDVATNTLRLCLHPDGIRPTIVNWETFAASLLDRVERARGRAPFDERLDALVTEVGTYPGVADLADRRPGRPSNELLMPMMLDMPVGRLRFVSMVAELDGPFDVALDELRIKTLLPLDRDTELALQEATGH